MTTHSGEQDDSADRAVNSTGDPDLADLAPGDARRLIRELRARQSELEMENEALRTKQQQLDLIIDTIPAYIAYLDADLTILHANQTMAGWWGHAKDQVVGKRFEEVAPPGGYERNAPYARQVVASRQSVCYELPQSDKEGRIIFARATFVPHLDTVGNVQGIAALILDVTGQREAEESLRRRVEELTVLHRIAHTMAAAAELPATLAQAGEIVAALFAAHCVHILWWEGDEAGFHVHVCPHPGSGPAGLARFDASLDDLAFLGPVLRAGRSQVVADVRSLLLSDLERELLTHRQVQSIMFVPLTIGGSAVGLLWVASDRPGHTFAASEVLLAETIALDLAAAIESARSVRQAQAAAIAEERSRLARDLHDSITQTLYTVSILAEALPRVLDRDLEDARRNARHMRQVVLGALAEMRTLLFELRPEALDAAGLGTLLEQLAASLRGRARVAVDLMVDGPLDLPRDVKIALYRIVQEAFNNVTRHAEATNVTATVQMLPDGLLLAIQDDGQGFDPGLVSAERMGLRFMRERAEANGLHLAIDSHVGLGTRIAVKWQKDPG